MPPPGIIASSPLDYPDRRNLAPPAGGLIRWQRNFAVRPVHPIRAA
jgi:hypothetical protein